MQYVQAKVLKEWSVTDENLAYFGEYVPGDIVAIPYLHKNPLIQAGFIEVIGDYPSASAPADIKGLGKVGELKESNVTHAESATPGDTKTEEKPVKKASRFSLRGKKA